MANHKIERIGSDITRVISESIISEARDSILHSVTITGCIVSKDLSYAKVYFTSLIDNDHKILEKELNEAGGFFRTEIAKKLNLRQTPKLNFVYDESIEYGKRIEDKIKQLHENE